MINLLLIRKYFSDISTIGELFIDGKFICYILEDKDRGLDSSWAFEKITKEKVYGRTAIPTGEYSVQWTFSNRFRKFTPILLNVKGYEGIRIHAGNTDVDTLGCLLPGLTMKENKVENSKLACEKLFTLIKTYLDEKKEIRIKIIRKP